LQQEEEVAVLATQTEAVRAAVLRPAVVLVVLEVLEELEEEECCDGSCGAWGGSFLPSLVEGWGEVGIEAEEAGVEAEEMAVRVIVCALPLGVSGRMRGGWTGREGGGRSKVGGEGVRGAR
jgi:hypothetical protein